MEKKENFSAQQLQKELKIAKQPQAAALLSRQYTAEKQPPFWTSKKILNLFLSGSFRPGSRQPSLACTLHHLDVPFFSFSLSFFWQTRKWRCSEKRGESKTETEAREKRRFAAVRVWRCARIAVTARTEYAQNESLGKQKEKRRRPSPVGTDLKQAKGDHIPELLQQLLLSFP